MNRIREFFDALSQFLRDLRELRVLLQQFQYLRGLPGCQILSLNACGGQCFAVLRIRIRVRFISIRLSRLSEQN
jgi:hypothetical protein